MNILMVVEILAVAMLGCSTAFITDFIIIINDYVINIINDVIIGVIKMANSGNNVRMIYFDGWDLLMSGPFL
jgi:hypothetical protein